MAKLQFSHDTIKKTQAGNVKQSLLITVDYDPLDESINDVDVDLFENGKFIAEISTLLDKAEGDPLATMIEAINWTDIYETKKMAQAA